ncbi:hypothetical protein P7K49_040853, partial [Saguinus oedipus]
CWALSSNDKIYLQLFQDLQVEDTLGTEKGVIFPALGFFDGCSVGSETHQTMDS